jgi:choline-sulfatase
VTTLRGSGAPHRYRLAGLLTLTMVGNTAIAEVPRARPRNILLLTCDALRADHLGAYGYPRPTSPNIDAFAREATVFANAVGQSAWTGPGIVSLLTGQYPAVHGMDTRHKVPDRFLQTVLEDLGARGFRPAAFQATGDLYGNLGLGEEDQMRFTLPELLRRMRDEPFVIWHHLRNSHLPYNAGAELRALFHRPEVPPLPADHLTLLTGSAVIPAGSVRWDAAEQPAIVDLYDAAVRQNDDDVGAALAALRELGLWDNTLVVLTADHAEELLEHGQVGHASTTQAGTLFEEVLRLPLIIRVPGTPGGRVVPGLAQPVDVMPTVLDALGLPADARLQGRSLLPEIRGERDRVPRAVAFSDTTNCGWQCAGNRQKTARLWAAKNDRWKLIVHRDAFGGVAQEHLFDLVSDPLETQNVLVENAVAAAALRRALAAHMTDNLGRAQEAMATALAGHRQELAQLAPAQRTSRAAAICDELAMLRYVYRVQNPSLFDQAAGARLWRRETRAILALLPTAARNYWACEQLR